eukprot:1180513-Prorocentrum_minimum.AAC.4
MLLSRYPMQKKKNNGGGKNLSEVDNLKNHWTLPPNKKRVVGRPIKGLNNEETREKYKTNKRKVSEQPDLGHGERKLKLLFQKHIKTNRRKDRDQSVENE